MKTKKSEKGLKDAAIDKPRGGIYHNKTDNSSIDKSGYDQSFVDYSVYEMNNPMKGQQRNTFTYNTAGPYPISDDNSSVELKRRKEVEQYQNYLKTPETIRRTFLSNISESNRKDSDIISDSNRSFGLNFMSKYATVTSNATLWNHNRPRNEMSRNPATIVSVTDDSTIVTTESISVNSYKIEVEEQQGMKEPFFLINGPKKIHTPFSSGYDLHITQPFSSSGSSDCIQYRHPRGDSSDVEDNYEQYRSKAAAIAKEKQQIQRESLAHAIQLAKQQEEEMSQRSSQSESEDTSGMTAEGRARMRYLEYKKKLSLEMQRREMEEEKVRAIIAKAEARMNSIKKN